MHFNFQNKIWLRSLGSVQDWDKIAHGFTELKLLIYSCQGCSHLINYFDFQVCLSICLCVQKEAPFPAVLSQNVTNKSCLVCVMSEKYASWVTLRPQWDRCRRGEAKVRVFNIKTTWSEFHYLPGVGPKQLCALAHLGCTRATGTSYEGTS